MSFDKDLQFVLRWEGGYVNNPNDRGGPTNKGVTQRVYDQYRVNKMLAKQSVKNITLAEVSDIYKNQYWNKINGDKLSPSVAAILFDGAVNSGPSRAIKFLQRALGLNDDGIFGPVTKQTLEEAEMRNIDALLTRLFEVREHFYKSIAVGSQRGFLKGWLNRLNSLKDYVRNEYR